MAAKQPPPLMKKHSQTDLVSRLKTRKILGVGGEDDDGEVHRSKVGLRRRSRSWPHPGSIPEHQFGEAGWAPPPYLGKEKLRSMQEPQDLAPFSRRLMEMLGK